MTDDVRASDSPDETYICGSSFTVGVPPPARHRRIAILGFGRSVRMAPVNDPSWELWAMNGFWRAAKPDFGIDVPESRYSLWLDMHTLEFTREYGKRAGFGDQQEEWLRRPHPFPVLALGEFGPDYPSVQAYPIDVVVAATGRDYFTSSVAYAIALAITLPDVAEIGMWGIDLVHDTEYAEQRPCAEYWLGRAEAMGITVTKADESALLSAHGRYGYDISNPLLIELVTELQRQEAGLVKGLDEARAQMEHLKNQMHTDDGALQATRGLLERLRAWSRGAQI